jgi:hypothetical protein
VLRIVETIVLVILISAGLFWAPVCEAQNRIAPAEYDYSSLALTSILDSAAEASKLPDVPQRVKLLINAAQILPTTQHDDAVRLLEVALRDVKEWDSEGKASWYQRHTAATLLTEVLAIYARVDPAKTAVLQERFQAEATSTTTTNSSSTSLKNEISFTDFSARSAIADQAAKIALALIDTDPEKAFRLVVQSLQGGTVSGVLFEIVQKLIQNGNRTFLDKIEMGIGRVLAANVTLDPSSLSYGALLVLADKDMSPAARSGFVSFFMRSLQAWAILVKEPGIDTSYISRAFFAFSQTVRLVISQYSPDQQISFDLVLDQVAPLVPDKTKSIVQAFQPETFSDPRDRLSDILKDPAPEMRDLRLVRLVSELLRNESEESQKRFDLASDAISGFSDPDAKLAYTDLLTITRINAFVKQKKFIEAQQVAGSISSIETRAWALLALSTVAANADRVLGFELISNALKALDTASSSPHKVELALIATGMLAKSDPQRAFETLSTASRYANSSASKVDPPTKPPFAFGLEATIGEAHTKLGVFPESLGELKTDPLLSTLATTDWFRADQIVNDIREPSLRLHLKLQFAGAVLVQKSKPKRKEVTPKTSVKDRLL